MTDINVLIPKPPDQQEQERRAKEQQRIEEYLRDRLNPPFKIENIFFVRPNHLLGNVLSIQAAHDWDKSVFWSMVACLFMTAQTMFILSFFLACAGAVYRAIH